MENTQLPPEIEDLRDQAETAAANLAMAEGAEEAAKVELEAAAAKVVEARIARTQADGAEAAARREYIAALRRHGYVQTADGPRPADDGLCHCTGGTRPHAYHGTPRP